MTDESNGTGVSLGSGSYDYDKLKKATDAAAKKGDLDAMAAAIESARVPAHPEPQQVPQTDAGSKTKGGEAAEGEK